MKKTDIILMGAGGHCRSVIDIFEQRGDFRILGLLDRADRVGQEVLGYAIIGSDDDIPRLIEERCRNFLVTVGQIKSPEPRMTLFERIKSAGGHLPAVVSPLANVSRHASVGEGSVIMHGALVNAAARVGRNVIVNSRALIEHDATVGDHCHISTASVLNGGVRVGQSCFVGSGAVVVQGVKIGSHSLVGAGTLVRHSLPPGSLFVGHGRRAPTGDGPCGEGASECPPAEWLPGDPS